MAEKKLTAKSTEKAIGYGYSDILSKLLTALDQPITNSDNYRTYYRQMMNEDETIGAGLEYLTGRVVSRIGNYSHENEQIQDMVNRSIESIRGTMTEVRRCILRDSFAFGFGAGEFTVKSDNGTWLLSSIQLFDPVNTQFKMKKFADNSFGIGAVVQKNSAGGDDIEIPAEKCLIKSYGDTKTPYGSSILRRCYRWWSFKKAIPKLWAVALERYGMPLLHGKTERSMVKKLEEALENANSRAYFVTDKETEVVPIAPPSAGIGASYTEAEKLCDTMIYRAMFLPSLLGGGENGGSYALGQVHLELFNSTAVALAQDYVDAELEQLWRPLIEWNFGEQENYGDFTINDDMPVEEKGAITSVLLNLAGMGVIDPASDRSWIREMLGLPDIDKDAVIPEWQLENKKSVKHDET